MERASRFLERLSGKLDKVDNDAEPAFMFSVAAVRIRFLKDSATDSKLMNYITNTKRKIG